MENRRDRNCEANRKDRDKNRKTPLEMKLGHHRLSQSLDHQRGKVVGSLRRIENRVEMNALDINRSAFGALLRGREDN
jgi:hypothetical protein